MFQEVTATGAY
jgi:chromosome segregation ATPase